MSVNEDRLGLEILSSDECWALLRAAAIGRIAFVEAGEPMVLPVTHTVDGHHLAFRSGAGTKLEAAAMARSVAFEADGWNATTHQGWSVLARGQAETVYDDAEIAALDAAGSQPWLDEARGGTWVRIRVDEISGRRLS